VADEAIAKIGTMLEELGVRFELVIEAVSGIGGRLDKLKDELFGQFSEVGGQIRFLSDQIGENRAIIGSLRSEFGAEMVRLGEMIGRTRVEFREQLGNLDASIRGELATQAQAARAAIHPAAPSREVVRELAHSVNAVKEEIASSADTTSRKLASELKQTNKTLSTLARKIERFDDKITVQVRDQEQRLRKLESGGRGR